MWFASRMPEKCVRARRDECASGVSRTRSTRRQFAFTPTGPPARRLAAPSEYISGSITCFARNVGDKTRLTVPTVVNSCFRHPSGVTRIPFRNWRARVFVQKRRYRRSGVSATTCVQAGRHSLTYFSTPACLTPEPYHLSSFKSLPAPAAGS